MCTNLVKGKSAKIVKASKICTFSDTGTVSIKVGSAFKTSTPRTQGAMVSRYSKSEWLKPFRKVPINPAVIITVSNNITTKSLIALVLLIRGTNSLRKDRMTEPVKAASPAKPPP